MDGWKRAILGMTALAAVALGAPISAAGADIVSGAYDDGALIGFDRTTRIVSGYVHLERGEQPSFSCIFYLRGELRASEAAVATYFPETPATDLINGRLILEAPMQFVIRLPDEHGGCWNVQHFADEKDPAEFSLQAAHPWRSIAVVKSDKAFFFDAPRGPTHRKAYVVKGDGVGVRASRPGWLLVDYVDGSRPVSGWIRRSDVYPDGR